MNKSTKMAIDGKGVPGRKGTGYPPPFDGPVKNRLKRRLGDHFGLTNFGVNMVTLEPGCWSSQRHWHTRQDEFIYVISGILTLVTDDGEQELGPGSIAGFKAGTENAHHLVNKSDADATYLEVGDRTKGDIGEYPDIDMRTQVDENGDFSGFIHKDGTPY
jgi:uncharacterized cupin superfamily protein